MGKTAVGNDRQSIDSEVFSGKQYEFFHIGINGQIRRDKGVGKTAEIDPQKRFAVDIQSPFAGFAGHSFDGGRFFQFDRQMTVDEFFRRTEDFAIFFCGNGQAVFAFGQIEYGKVKSDFCGGITGILQKDFSVAFQFDGDFCPGRNQFIAGDNQRIILYGDFAPGYMLAFFSFNGVLIGFLSFHVSKGGKERIGLDRYCRSGFFDLFQFDFVPPRLADTVVFYMKRDADAASVFIGAELLFAERPLVQIAGELCPAAVKVT